MRRALPVVTADLPRDAPIAAWLHQGPNSQPTVAITFPGTYRAISITRRQLPKLIAALQVAHSILSRDDPQERHVSIDLMKRSAS